MNTLKEFLLDLDYIIEIYDDIGKCYLELKEDVNIYDVYNKNDIQLFIKVNRTCHNISFRKTLKRLSYIEIPDLILYYSNYKLDEVTVVNPKAILNCTFQKYKTFPYEIGKNFMIEIKNDLDFLKVRI